jgi:hypothetical protein
MRPVAPLGPLANAQASRARWWRRRATLALAVATLVVVGIAVLPTLRLPQGRSLPPTAEGPPARTLEPGPLARGRYRLPSFSPPLTLDIKAPGGTRSWSGLWGPVIRFMSCNLRIFMDQPTEPILSGNPPAGGMTSGSVDPSGGACPKARCGR